MKRFSALLAVVVIAMLSPGIGLGNGLTDLDLDSVDVGNRPTLSNYPTFPATPPIAARLLVDRAHLGNFDVSGFTDHLTANGWIVGELVSGPVTTEALAGWDIYLIPVKTTAAGLAGFSEEEVDAVAMFLKNGGGLWAFHEYSRDPTGINSLTSRFGVLFHDDTVNDPTDNAGPGYESIAFIQNISQHPVTEGVDRITYHGGCCLDVQSPALVLAQGDEDAYSMNCSSVPPVLAVTSDTGRAVFCGDITPMHPSYFPEYLTASEIQLLINIANWLAIAPVPTEETSWSTLKCLYR
ncbi:MAG: hypothetical protein KAH56_12330 [Candidatus Krumholzibacteria bacterium]|nr:hypothetical protein [Candidatus Krumholzibacteria bacterium]